MNKGNYLDKTLKNAISKAKILKPANLEFEVNTINKYYKFGMKKSVMDKFDSGLLKAIVLPPGTAERIPASVPFLLYGANEIGSYVFIDTYCQYNKSSDTYNIDPKKLYCLLCSSYCIVYDYTEKILVGSFLDCYCIRLPSIIRFCSSAHSIL